LKQLSLTAIEIGLISLQKISGFWYCCLQLAWTPQQAVAYGSLHQYNIMQSMKILFQVNLICKLFTSSNDIAMEVQVRANFH
jgi:hypothetical protein